jgi:hypothetical protein
MAKYRFPGNVVRPYVAAGVAWDTLRGLTQTITQTVISTSVSSKTTTSSPAELRNKTVTGFVAGFGVDIHLVFLNISPEIRYTRWGSQQFVAPPAFALAVIAPGVGLVKRPPRASGHGPK